MSFEITTNLLLLSFAGAVLMGAIAHKTNFCTMGSVSDWVNMGNTARLGSWFLSIAVAIIGVAAIELYLEIPLDSTLPPYRTAEFAWLRYLLGGLMFGIGMSLAGGCGSKTLINVGGGSIRSIVVLIIAGVMAYLMTKTAFYEIVFHSWINATTISLSEWSIQSQSIVDIFSAITGMQTGANMHLILALLVAALFMYFAFRSKQFRKNKALIFAGASIGSLVVAGWYASGGPLGQEVIEQVEWMDERPLGVGVQSYTFVNPMGEMIAFFMSPTNSLLITFGLVALVGVIVGAFISALVSGSFKITSFSGSSDVIKHVIGGVLMGTGGVLAMGCTIGQGITGVSTLAVGSVIALFSIILGSALTIKISYYQMMYEDEASFMACLLSTLVDFRMLPESLRKLEEP